MRKVSRIYVLLSKNNEIKQICRKVIRTLGGCVPTKDRRKSEPPYSVSRSCPFAHVAFILFGVRELCYASVGYFSVKRKVTREINKAHYSIDRINFFSKNTTRSTY
ncbi:MAG: hypothetical protein LBQ28_08600 [Prevotellaceae bacterium]|nr:hypothetical protein [Prevotellaceae bacterium]